MGSQPTSPIPAGLAHMLEGLNAWCQEQPVRMCVLFGSQATGKTHAQSDVDVAVWPTQPVSAATKLSWIRELQELLEKDVSLVLVSPDLDPVLGFEIVRNGRLAFEREQGLWTHHQAQLWHAYNDSLPFRRAARQELHQFAQEMRRDT